MGGGKLQNQEKSLVVSSSVWLLQGNYRDILQLTCDIHPAARDLRPLKRADAQDVRA